MTKSARKIFALLLSLALCIGMLPAVAFAATSDTIDYSQDTSKTKVLGYISTDSSTKLIYEGEPRDATVDNLDVDEIEADLEAAKQALSDYAAEKGLTIEGIDDNPSVSYIDTEYDNRKYEWADGYETYPEASEGRTMIISGVYGTHRRYYVELYVSGSLIDEEEVEEYDFTLALSQGKGYKNSPSGDEVNLADFNIEAFNEGDECVYLFKDVNFVTSTPVGIHIFDDNATIDMPDSNNLVVTGGSDNSNTIAILADGDLSICGGGSLMVFAGEGGYESTGIRVDGKFNVWDGNIEACCGSANNGSCYGIWVYGGLTMGGGSLTANAIDATNDSYGAYIMNGFTMLGGSLVCNGGNATERTYGIYVGSNVDIIISDGQLTAKGDESATNGYGLATGSNCSFTITGGQVELSGPTLASAKWDGEYVANAPTTLGENGENFALVVAGPNASGSDTSDINEWIGDGSDDVSAYRFLLISPDEGGDENDNTDYTIIEGANQTVEQGDEATFRSDAEYAKFVTAIVDGSELSKDDYTDSEGSTIITLKQKYTKALSVGNHTLEIVSNDGVAKTTFKVKKAKSAIVDNEPIEVKPSAPSIPQTDGTVSAAGFSLVAAAMLLAVTALLKKRCTK